MRAAAAPRDAVVLEVLFRGGSSRVSNSFFFFSSLLLGFAATFRIRSEFDRQNRPTGTVPADKGSDKFKLELHHAAPRRAGSSRAVNVHAKAGAAHERGPNIYTDANACISVATDLGVSRGTVVSQNRSFHTWSGKFDGGNFPEG